MEKEARKDRELFGRELQQQRSAALSKIHSKYRQLTTDKQFQFQRQAQQNQLQSELTKTDLKAKS